MAVRVCWMSRAGRVLLQPQPQIAAHVDLSPRMIELAQQLYPTVEYREADVEHLPFPDRRFDAVVCASGADIFPGQNSLSQSAYEPYRPADALHFHGGMIRRGNVFKASSVRLLPRSAYRRR